MLKLSQIALFRILVFISLHFMKKKFCHQDSKNNINQRFHFVSWCLCGNLFRLVRVRISRNTLPPPARSVYFSARGFKICGVIKMINSSI